MKVIKINKSYRNGSKIHFIIVEDHYENDYIDNLVEDWCENDLSGHNYGYQYIWDIVEDANTIEEALQYNISIIKNNISSLEIELKKLIDCSQEGIRSNKLNSL